MKIILTSPELGTIRLTGEREILSLEDHRRDYVQVSLPGPGPFDYHVGWMRVEDLANAFE